MLIGDYSTTPPFKKLADKYEDRLVELRLWEAPLRRALEPFPDLDIETHWNHPKYQEEARLNKIFAYLREKAKTPLHHALLAHYKLMWPGSDTYSYFFPQDTYSSIWFRAAKRIREMEQAGNNP